MGIPAAIIAGAELSARANKLTTYVISVCIPCYCCQLITRNVFEDGILEAKANIFNAVTVLSIYLASRVQYT